MSIVIINAPAKYTPVDSPILFQLTSDNPNTVYFGVQVLDSATNGVIANQKYQLLPNYSGGTAFDLSSILDSYVDYQIVNSGNLIEPTPKVAKAYNLIITENLVSGSTIVSGSTVTGSTYNVWNAEFDRVRFNSYSYLDYSFTIYGGTKFLTHKPLISNIYQSSTEYLYFLNDGQDASVKYDFYGFGNTLLGSHVVSGMTSGNTAYRINVSPTAIDSYFGNVFSNTYGGEFGDSFSDPFGTLYSISNTNYFTVQVIANSGTTKSEIRTYILRSDSCKAEPLQLLFSNSLGGFDTCTVFNPMETMAVTKSSVSIYPYQINAAGDYTNINDGVYNQTDLVYNVDRTSTYKVFSEVLNDDTAKWIKGLIHAKVVYAQLSNGDLLPVTINTTSYSILKRRYSTDNNRLQLEFKVKESGLNF